jgi:hypothetical protein
MIRLVRYGQLSSVEEGDKLKNIVILQDDSGREVTLEVSEKSLQDLVTFSVTASGRARTQEEEQPDIPLDDQLPQDELPIEGETEEAQQEAADPEEFTGSPFPPRRG